MEYIWAVSLSPHARWVHLPPRRGAAQDLLPVMAYSPRKTFIYD